MTFYETINIGIIFGGKSAEHEVSLQSAKNVFDAINREKYNPVLIGIDKSGRWLLSDESKFLINENNPKLIRLNQSHDVVTFAPESNGLISNITNQKESGSIDVAFPILHGPMGEDGTVQGLLKLANIPFVGSSVLGSAVGMDKDIMKRLLRDGGIPIARFTTVVNGDEIPDFGVLAKKIGIPFFIKPANMGSSVGVNKVQDENDYKNAIAEAFTFDLKVIIEEFIDGREIECSVLGNNRPIASTIGEIKSSHDFYSYEAKYIDENGAILEIPANLSKEVLLGVRSILLYFYALRGIP